MDNLTRGPWPDRIEPPPPPTPPLRRVVTRDYLTPSALVEQLDCGHTYYPSTATWTWRHLEVKSRRCAECLR